MLFTLNEIFIFKYIKTFLTILLKITYFTNTKTTKILIYNLLRDDMKTLGTWCKSSEGIRRLECFAIVLELSSSHQFSSSILLNRAMNNCRGLTCSSSGCHTSRNGSALHNWWMGMCAQGISRLQGRVCARGFAQNTVAHDVCLRTMRFKWSYCHQLINVPFSQRDNQRLKQHPTSEMYSCQVNVQNNLHSCF
jgi:hypothetical protein